ncbi:hypothetical protein JFV29_00605 [Peribacillus sp. TH16]|uniref:hypothetical protein n=1 Tax=unclassified Peribacillus TaxID=2675266 RepID=UPI001914330B|nr:MULTISPECIES: hypothetical protein [unclassified Peribacillus]MBK5441512.1 hypothetical protein [Peribacillus sp. TH24]MBK5458556.1 hypothetical protein [Peribacillus sp. TH27]MBK5480459.1 hypothetical protein [Peribacillus sp. TH16]WMX58048.1 hypothetical protein RE409_12985 [Peribacillus sp. R9-11]
MSIKKSQTFVQLDVRNWDNAELVESLYEICETSKEYENDVVEVHQVVDLGKLKNEWRYLIILNISQDLDNLGAQIDHY